jgi:hypothetical protein
MMVNITIVYETVIVYIPKASLCCGFYDLWVGRETGKEEYGAYER